MEITFFI